MLSDVHARTRTRHKSKKKKKKHIPTDGVGFNRNVRQKSFSRPPARRTEEEITDEVKDKSGKLSRAALEKTSSRQTFKDLLERAEEEKKNKMFVVDNTNTSNIFF